MYKNIVALLMVIATAYSLFAEKPQLKPYGFIKGDMYISTGGVNSWFSKNPTATTRANGEDTTVLAFSAAHSRFGLAGSANVKDVTIGGKVELDFFSANSNTNANANPRLRQAYAWVMPIKGLDIRIGQQWDIFSPLNPSTNNTNANLWYCGNYGFRRPMFQARYTIPIEAVSPSFYLSVGEGAKESDTLAGQDNLSLMPLIQGRAGLALQNKMAFGFSFLTGQWGEDKDFSTWGINVDVNLPFHKLFALKGEFGTGSNLNNANIWNIAGSGGDGDERTVLGVWANIISKPLDALNFVVGFGVENNTTEDLADGETEQNMTVYGDIIIPIADHFSFTLEYQQIMTSVKGVDDYSAGVIDISGKVIF